MRFLNPAVLPWLWLALVPLALYLFRRKSRTVPVSTLLFFKSLAREHQESAWLRRLKRWASLLLSLLLVCGPVVALARLMMAPGGSEARRVVVVVDTSASMGARDGAGETRLGRALALVRARLAGLPESVPVALVAAGESPDVIHPVSANRRELLRALGGLTVRPVADDADAAWATAAAMAGMETPSEVWWASDRPLAPSMTGPAGVTRREIGVALENLPNAGITAFAVSRVPLLHSRYQAYVQVALNAGAEAPRTAILEPRIAGLPLARRELTLQPGVMQGLTIEIEAAQEQVIEVILQMDGDALDADNRVAARLPALRPLVVAWITPTPDPFTTLALQALATDGELEIFTGNPSQWPPPQLPDVAIFDGWLPDPWPEAVPALVINPTGSAGPVRARPLVPPVPRDDVRAVDESHPVVFRLNPSRLALAQTAAIDATGIWQPLWRAGGQTVLAAAENGGQRIVLLACAPSQSERLPLTTSYPLLLANTLAWCSEPLTTRRSPHVQPTGSLVEGLMAPIEWREWDGDRLGAPTAVPAPPSGITVLDRLGLWRTTDGQREGASALLSRQETDLGGTPAGREIAPEPGALATAARGDPGEAGEAGASDVSEASGVLVNAPPEVIAPPQAAAVDDGWRSGFGLGGELTRWVMALVLGVLLIESWLFHRHAVS